jgi:dihydropteroate synthase
MTFRKRDIDFNTPKVMGILNVTPDSLSDGGQFSSLESALQQARVMVQAGASFIDVGGESTRPGAIAVSLQEELDRVIPVIEALTQELDAIVSIDTSKARVMTEAVHVGASLINDVRALQNEGSLEAAIKAANQFNVPSCLMHMQGKPNNMQNAPNYDSNDGNVNAASTSGVVQKVTEFFNQRINQCQEAGLNCKHILIDPGFGFGKTLDHNYQLLKHLQSFHQFNVPVLVGMSRKSMIGDLLNRDLNQRLAGNIATATIAALSGVGIIRVHDVVETIDAVNIVNKLQSLE